MSYGQSPTELPASPSSPIIRATTPDAADFLRSRGSFSPGAAAPPPARALSPVSPVSPAADDRAELKARVLRASERSRALAEYDASRAEEAVETALATAGTTAGFLGETMSSRSRAVNWEDAVLVAVGSSPELAPGHSQPRGKRSPERQPAAGARAESALDELIYRNRQELRALSLTLPLDPPSQQRGDDDGSSSSDGEDLFADDSAAAPARTSPEQAPPNGGGPRWAEETSPSTDALQEALRLAELRASMARSASAQPPEPRGSPRKTVRPRRRKKAASPSSTPGSPPTPIGGAKGRDAPSPGSAAQAHLLRAEEQARLDAVRARNPAERTQERQITEALADLTAMGVRRPPCRPRPCAPGSDKMHALAVPSGNDAAFARYSG